LKRPVKNTVMHFILFFLAIFADSFVGRSPQGRFYQGLSQDAGYPLTSLTYADSRTIFTFARIDTLTNIFHGHLSPEGPFESEEP